MNDYPEIGNVFQVKETFGKDDMFHPYDLIKVVSVYFKDGIKWFEIKKLSETDATKTCHIHEVCFNKYILNANALESYKNMEYELKRINNRLDNLKSRIKSVEQKQQQIEEILNNIESSK